MSLILMYFNVWKSVSKSDTVNFDGTAAGTLNAKPCDGIYVGTAGTVVAVAQNGQSASYTAVSGEILPLRAIRIDETNTTGGAFVAMYLN